MSSRRDRIRFVRVFWGAPYPVKLTNNKKPLVTVGMPVFNAERYVREAIDAILAQTYCNIELIISDNASTDRTPIICDEASSTDARVRIYHQPKNIGAPRNWNFLVGEARGKYFKWASASDICSDSFIAKCVGGLQDDPEIVLCYGYTQYLGEGGSDTEIFTGDKSIEFDRPSERFAAALGVGVNNIQQGLFRVSSLRQTRLDRLYPSGDLALMAELSLLGKFRLLPEVLLYRRRTQSTFTSFLTPLERARIYHPEASKPMKLIRGRFYADIVGCAIRSKVVLVEKIRCLLVAGRRIWWESPTLMREFISLFGFGSRER